MPRKKKTIDWEEVGSKALKIIIGILLMIGGGFLIWLWWPEFLYVLKGLVGVIVLLIGLLILVIGALE